MNKRIKYVFAESNKELIQKINTNINRINNEVLSKEQKDEIVYTIQNLQNELNLRLVSHSTWLVKILSLITIGLTIFTILFSIYTNHEGNYTSLIQKQNQNKELQLLEQILKETKRIK